MKTDNYFHVMAVCGVVSVALLSLGLFMGQQAWLAMAGGVVPMIYYHVGYLWPRAKKGGLSQAAIDSVYYYGFLVTIAALSLSALVIGRDGAAGQVTTVVYQFGAGLLATAYAVVARMHLSSVATILDSTSPEAILDRYMKRSLELVDNADIANAKMQQYVALIIQRTAEFDTAARSRTERVMMETAGVFAREFKATLDEARAGLADVRATATDLSMQTARQGLGHNLDALQTAIQRLTNHFDELSTHSRQTAQGAKDATRSSDELDATLSRLNQSIEALAGEQGSLSRSVHTLTSGSVALAEGTSAMSEGVTTLKTAAHEIQAAAPAFQSLSKISKKVHQQLATVDEVVAKLEESLRHLGVAGEHVGRLGHGMHELAESLPSLSQQATSLTGELSRAESAAQRLSGNLTDLAPRRAELTELSSHIESALQQVAGSVTVVAQNARELSGSGPELAKLVQTLTELVSQAAGLRTVIAAAEEGLVSFTTTTQATDRALGTSSQSLAASIAASSQGIADDLRRSSQASAMLTERLVQVVNNIVERTRTQQGLPT